MVPTVRRAPSVSAVSGAGSEGVIMDLESLRVVAGGATILAGGCGVALSTAVIGAMVEAVWPGAGTRVSTGAVSALSVALRAFCLVGMAVVTFVMLAGVLAVALFRLVKGVRFVRTVSTGRHATRGRGRRSQRAGAHRGARFA